MTGFENSPFLCWLAFVLAQPVWGILVAGSPCISQCFVTLWFSSAMVILRETPPHHPTTPDAPPPPATRLLIAGSLPCTCPLQRQLCGTYTTVVRFTTPHAENPYSVLLGFQSPGLNLAPLAARCHRALKQMASFSQAKD